MELFSIIFTILTCMGVFALALLGLHYVWLKQHNSDVPKPNSGDLLNPRDQNISKLKSFRDLINIYLPILWEFDVNYWLKNVGLDGYTYLYFQREMLKMFILFGFSSCFLL